MKIILESLEAVHTHTCNLKENKKGITLIALVITLIILLMLAGITVVALSGENGLFSKTKQAREKYSIGEAKEKLTTKLMQLQTEVTDEEQRSATIEDINKLVDENSKYYDKEIESVKDRNENKLVKISGYYFEVDGQLNIVGNIDASELAVTETTYKVNSTNGNIMNVTVNIKNEIGIQKVIKPDNTDVKPAGLKEQVAIDYDVEDGKEYKFKVQLVGSNEQKEYTLKANLNAKPEIKQNESNEYPTITEYGVEINKIVKIDYGENTDNYYSLDNGNSWIKYTEDEVSVKKEGKILAKSVINGEITKESQENITMQLASDALASAAFDKNDTSYDLINTWETKKVLIDQELIGKDIFIKLYSYDKGGYYSFIRMYSSDGVELSSSKFATTDQDVSITVPKNARYMTFYSAGWVNTYVAWMRIYEIGYNNTPQVTINKKYPTIVENNVTEAYSEIKIDYDDTSVKRLYKIDDEEWKEYSGNIDLKIGSTINVKGIDVYGNDTIKTITYTAVKEDDALQSEAYDKDESTYALINTWQTKKIYIDHSLVGRKISIKLYSYDKGGYYSFIRMYSSDGTELNSRKFATCSQIVDIDVPDNASYLTFYSAGWVDEYVAWMRIYEIYGK